MNGIDLKRDARFHPHYGGTLRTEHGRHLTRLAVVNVCRTIMEKGLWGISTNAFSKRVGRQYQRLRMAREIPYHDRPRLTIRGMERLLAFIREIPQDTRYADALEGVLVYCIEYRESKLERWYRERPVAPRGLTNPPDIPEGW